MNAQTKRQHKIAEVPGIKPACKIKIHAGPSAVGPTTVAHKPNDIVPVRLVTLHEAATLLRLSPRTLARLVTLKRVPGYRFAGMKKLFFKPEELLALLQPTIVRPVQRRTTTPSTQET